MKTPNTRSSSRNPNTVPATVRARSMGQLDGFCGDHEHVSITDPNYWETASERVRAAYNLGFSEGTKER